MNFQDLCYEYKELKEKKEGIEGVLLSIIRNLKNIQKRYKALLSPKTDAIITKRSGHRYYLVKNTEIIFLKERKRKFYCWAGWKSYSFSDDHDFAPVGIGVSFGDDDFNLGVLVNEEPLSEDTVALIKSISRKIKRFQKKKEKLEEVKKKIEKEIVKIIYKVAKEVFESNSFDETELEITKSYIEEALQKGIFDLDILMRGKRAENSKGRLLDLIFGNVKEKAKGGEEKEKMKVYVEDFDMSYVIIPSEREGWIVKDGKDFMLIDKSFVPQAGVYFYKGKVKKTIIDKRGREVPIIDIIGKF